jgi:hypothetical protein
VALSNRAGESSDSLAFSFGTKQVDGFDDCVGCATFYATAELTNGRCYECHQQFLNKREVMVAKANERALATAARHVLAGIAGANKGEAMSPAFMEGAMRRLGGAENFGDICARELQKCRGIDPDTGLPPANGVSVRESPTLAVKWGEMLARMMARNDERQSVEVGNLTDEDLASTLQSLSLDLVENNEDYCLATLSAILAKRPELIDKAMDAAGKPVVDAEVAEEEPLPTIDLSEIGIDDSCDEDEDSDD